jgi:hypothetical protein
MITSVFRLTALLAACLALVLPAQAAVTVLDVTADGSSATGTATLGGGFIVQQNSVQPAGTGVIDPFLRLQQAANDDQERAYNTSLGFPLDAKPPVNFTHALLLSAVPVVNIGGIDYREFLLDVNQTANEPISLNQVQLFQSAADVGLTFNLVEATAANNAIISFPAATEVFRLSDQLLTGTAFEVLTGSGHGSGESDLALYVRDSLFSGAGTFVTLFSQFGLPPGTLETNDGFEEWFTINPNVIPEPMSIVIWSLMGLGWAGFAAVRRRRAIHLRPEWAPEARTSIRELIEQGRVH